MSFVSCYFRRGFCHSERVRGIAILIYNLHMQSGVLGLEALAGRLLDMQNLRVGDGPVCGVQA